MAKCQGCGRGPQFEKWLSVKVVVADPSLGTIAPGLKRPPVAAGTSIYKKSRSWTAGAQYQNVSVHLALKLYPNHRKLGEIITKSVSIF